MHHLYKAIFLIITLFSGASIASAVCGPFDAVDPATGAPCGAGGGGGGVGADVTPPVNQGTPAISNIANTTADFTAQTDEQGNGYYIVVTTGSTAPTAQQVKDQLDYTGVAIVAKAVVGMQPFANTVMNITGLTPGTAYTAYFVADDLAFNLQTTQNMASAAFTTTGAANAAPVLAGTFTTNGAVNDNATITPFAQVTVTDANAGDQVSVAITYTAVNGTLAGTGITGTAGNYTVTAATPATAQTNLQAAVFTPATGQVTTGLTVATTFTLTPNDGTINGAANATTQVTATSVARSANVENTPALTGTTFSDTGHQMGQSFTAPRTGTLASINIASSVASTGAALKIYSGEGTAGALLHTQTIAVLNNTAVTAAVVQSYAYQALPLDAVVNVTSGQVYTFEITATGYFPVYDADNYALGMQYNRGTGIPNNDNFFQAVINGANSAPALGGTFVTAGAINDTATIAPFAAVTLTDADGDMLSVNITYTAANGTLSGTGLSGTAGNYTVDSAVIATAQSNLQGITFTPTTNQVAIGATKVTNFALTPNDSTSNGASDATTQVTATSVNVAPTGNVVITGNKTQNGIQTADMSAVSDADGLPGTFTYQWVSAGAPITGANSATYTPTQGQVNSALFVRVAYTDLGGTAELLTSASVTVLNANDAPTGAVTITGSATENVQLAASGAAIADIDGMGAFSFSWQRAGVDIVGANASRYILTQADVGQTITATVKYTDGGNTAETVVSTATVAVANVNDAPTGTVTITGTPTQGQVLTANNTLADVDGMTTSTVVYTWSNGATGSTYTLLQADVGNAITVTASYTDDQQTAESKASTATAAVANINDAPTGNVTITGNAIRGQQLTAVNAIVDADGTANATFTYQWFSAAAAINAATASTYTPVQADVGNTITVTISYTDDLNQAESLTSAATAAVLPGTPTITSAIYDGLSNTLVVTAANLAATAGAANDIDPTKLSFTGQGGASYTLTSTAVEIDSATQFTIVLNAADRINVEGLLNKNGTAAVDGVVYNIAAAANWNVAQAGNADLIANAVTLSNSQLPTITSGTYDAATGILTVTGSHFVQLAGANNDIIANKVAELSVHPMTVLSNSANVDITSETEFAIQLSSADKNTINIIMNKNGKISSEGNDYTFIVSAGWNSTISGFDATGKGTTTVKNVAVPTITSASYNAANGNLVVTGAGFLSNEILSDVLANKFTFRGQAGGSYLLTNTANVEISSGTSFTMVLSTTDKAQVNLLLDNNGTTSTGGTTYNLAAADNWAAGADPALNVADLTLNAIAVSNANALPTGNVAITGTTASGQILTANSNTIADANGMGSFAYQWKRGTAVIANATAATYTLLAADEGKAITVSISYTDGLGNAEVLISAALNIPIPAAPLFTGAPLAAVTVEATAVNSQPTLTNPATSGVAPIIVSNNAPAAGFPLGTTAVIWTATDANGKQSTTTENIVVADTTPPVIGALNQVATVEATGNLTDISLIEPAVTEIFLDRLTNDAPDRLATWFIFGRIVPGLVTSFPIGTTIVSWIATDTSGNTSTATQNIVVADTTPPQIAPLNQVATVEATGTNTPVFLKPPATNDVSAVTLTNNAPVVTSTDASGQTTTGTAFPIGTTVVTWTATDAAGNASTATQNIVVADTTPPTITLKGASTVTKAIGDVFTDPGATGTDLNLGDLDASIVKGGTFKDTTTAGTFTITYDVTSAGGIAAAQMTRTIIINPNAVKPISFAGFAAAKSYVVGLRPISIISADVNGDQIADLIVGNASNLRGGDIGFSVLLADATNPGSFLARKAFISPSQASYSVVSADFNGDGKRDIAVGGLTNANVQSNTSVYLNDAANVGSFVMPGKIVKESAYGVNTGIVTSADFNGDGRADLAILEDSGIVIALADAANPGSFLVSGKTYPVGASPSAIISADFTGNGKADLAVVNEGSNSVSIYHADVANPGSFNDKPSYPIITYPVGNAPVAITAGDFNGDGAVDLAVANRKSSNVSLLLNTPGVWQGLFAKAIPVAVDNNSIFNTSVPFYPNDIASADFNGDGKLDLVVADFPSTSKISLLLADAANPGSFASAGAYDVGVGWNRSLVSADFNGDGIADLASANSSGHVNVLLGIKVTANTTTKPVGVVVSTGSIQNQTTTAATTAPANVNVIDGVVSYEIHVPNKGDTANTTLFFSKPVPADAVVYKVDKAGNYTAIPQSKWSINADGSVKLSLTDGGPFDLDGLANGVIVDPVAVGTPATGGGGGGCAISTNSNKFDPMLPLLALLAMASLWYRRKRV